MRFATCYRPGVVSRVVGRRARTPLAIGLLVIGLGLGGLTQNWFVSATGSSTLGAEPVAVLRMAGAALVLGAVLSSTLLQRLLATRVLLFIGKISFPLYLVHVLVECSLGCHIYLMCVQDWETSHTTAFGFAAAATISVSVFLAWVGSLTVEPLSIWLGRKIYYFVFAARASHSLPVVKQFSST